MEYNFLFCPSYYARVFSGRVFFLNFSLQKLLSLVFLLVRDIFDLKIISFRGKIEKSSKKCVGGIFLLA